MAVSFRVTGTWAELTADGSVTIPSTPQAGDRMFLFARWKDFSITAQVTSPSGWTKITEFTDGSTSSGNGTGSVKVACWYRDWQSGDTAPTVDFSVSPTNSSVVIMVMAKASTDVWLTPLFVTAAMTNWTTSSQSVSASSTAAVLSGSVVMGLIGIRDDSTGMTRPTTGIDDSTGAITWNGNYVESPATHHTTVTGDDGSADLGYRLVTTGATATLRMTGTIDASETGAALWIVQGVQVNLVIQDASHAHSAASLLLAQTHALTVANASHAHTAANTVLTQVHVLSIQNASHAHTSSNVALTQAHSLVVQDASHAHSAGSPALAQAHVLTIQNASHAHSSGTPTLSVTHNLAIQDASHAHIAESFALAQVHELVIADADHAHTAQSPNVRTTLIIWIDPGGDAVEAPGYFNAPMAGSAGPISFDTSQKVVGVGSYKFDSDTGAFITGVTVPGVLGNARRVSTYFRYDSVPDAMATSSEFVSGGVTYSDTGFADSSAFHQDDGLYATASPAKNAGQGTAFASLGLNISVGAVIDSVKIIYERSYDIDTSIGISRVKWRIDGVEGPDHDNTDQPLTDTIVEVDVTADRAWTWQDLTDVSFEVIAEARRGDTDTAHTQSWDYVKVEVQYHMPTSILLVRDSSNSDMFELAINPKDAGVVLRLVDGAGVSYDGITDLPINTWNRISFSYVFHGADDLDINVYINGIQELSMVGANTAGHTIINRIQYGWVRAYYPGANHLCWFDQLYIDDGDDLSDCGNKFSTAKLPASVNENNWNTTVGTGAVDERPLSETNYMKHTAASAVNQTYTLQAASVGDVDISGATLLGYFGWAWAVAAGDLGSLDVVYLIVNGVQTQFATISGTPSMARQIVTSSSYPSDAAGIGMVSNDDFAQTLLYECGVIVAYEGPMEESLLAYQLLAQDSVTNIIDDLRADPQTSYEVGYNVGESDAMVSITVSSVPSEGQEPELQASMETQGGSGRTRIDSGIEVDTTVEVADGSAMVGIRRFTDVD